MCIRDRFLIAWTIISISSFSNKKLSSNIFLASSLESWAWLNEVLFLYKIKYEKGNGQKDHGVKPVSYTHLDVYKRQTYGFFSSSLTCSSVK